MLFVEVARWLFVCSIDFRGNNKRRKIYSFPFMATNLAQLSKIKKNKAIFINERNVPN